MNPTLPLWVLLVGAPTTFGTAPGSVSASRSALAMQGELTKFSAGWSVRFAQVLPVEEPAADDGSALSERVEALLGSAQTALGALRATEAEESLAEAEGLLRAHPELPQAAWLAAERASLAADLVEPRDPGAARLLRERAMLLEGRRVAPFRDAARPDAPLADPVNSRVTIRGAFARDELEWDSQPTSAVFEASPGEHQLRVLRGQRVVWARWVAVEGVVQDVHVTAPEVAPCSADDLGGTFAEARGPRALASTRCPQWAAGRYDGKKLMIALCRESTCGPWRAAPEEAAAPIRVTPSGSSGFPRWAIYGIAGVGAATLTAILVAQSGVFASEPSSERYTYGGFHPAR